MVDAVRGLQSAAAQFDEEHTGFKSVNPVDITTLFRRDAVSASGNGQAQNVIKD